MEEFKPLPITVSTLFLGGAVTFLVVVLGGWRAYDYLGKFLAVVLIANLSLLLVNLVRAKRGTRKVRPAWLLDASLVCLTLATMYLHGAEAVVKLLTFSVVPPGLGSSPTHPRR